MTSLTYPASFSLLKTVCKTVLFRDCHQLSHHVLLNVTQYFKNNFLKLELKPETARSQFLAVIDELIDLSDVFWKMWRTYLLFHDKCTVNQYPSSHNSISVGGVIPWASICLCIQNKVLSCYLLSSKLHQDYLTNLLKYRI